MIGIIGAMDIEVDALLERMEDVNQDNYGDIIFYVGKIAGKELVLCKSGVGKVNAAITTTLLLNKFPIDYVINIGTAGGLRKDQNTLDIVISKDVIQHDFDTSYIDGPKGLGLRYASDLELRKKVRLAFESNNRDSKIFEGDIISGDIFVGEENKSLELIEKFPTAIACEMESGAIGQTCQRMNTPFIVIRSLSDIVQHDNSGIDFIKNVGITSQRSADMVEAFLQI